MMLWSDMNSPNEARSILKGDEDWRAAISSWIAELREPFQGTQHQFQLRTASALELLIEPARPVLSPAEIACLKEALEDALWSVCLSEAETWKERGNYWPRRRHMWSTRAIALRLYLSARDLS